MNPLRIFMTERVQTPHEVGSLKFGLLHKFIGTSAVEGLVMGSSEDRELAGKETGEYLAVCTDDELLEAARKLDHLYAAATVANSRVTTKTVDVFAHAFMRVVKSEGRPLGEDAADSLEQIVTMARYRSQNHAPEPLPFTYD